MGQSRWFDTMTAIDCATLHRNGVYECVVLWDHFGPRLEAEFPRHFEILNLVVISPEGGKYFNL